MGWSKGQGSPGRGEAPQQDSWPAGQWQFRKVTRPQRGCCLFFGGGGHEAGPQPKGKSPELEKRGGGRGGAGHRVSTERILLQSEPWRWIPGRPPHQVVCAAPLLPLLPANCGSGSLPADLIFGQFGALDSSPPQPGPSPCFPPAGLARAGRLSQREACPHLEIKSPPGIDISPRTRGRSRLRFVLFFCLGGLFGFVFCEGSFFFFPLSKRESFVSVF